jgi:hypothetical protein
MTTFPKNGFWNIRRLEDVILSWRFLFTVNRDENIVRESFSFKIISRTPLRIYKKVLDTQ